MYYRTDFLLFVLVLVLVTNFSESATKKVIVSRCCKNGNSIEKIEGQTMCYPGATTEWNPRIYSLRKKVFLNVIPGSWNIAEGNMPDCGKNKKPILLKENSYLLLESGMLFYENTKITPDRFCSDIQQALVCLDNIEDHQETLSQIPQITIQKCCGTKAVYNHKESKCIVWNTTVNIELNSESKNITFNLISGFPNCHNDTGNFDIAGSFDKFTLQDDGSLTEGVTSWEQSSYCLEHFSESTTDPPNVLVCPRGIRIVAEERFDLKYILYPIGLLISAVFLAATLATSFLLPSSHHLLHWRCQTNHVACLLVADVLLAISQLAGHQIRGVPCSLLAITMHFFFLAAFFWLNTMCFNIWWTFRDLRPASLEKGQEACRLRLYEAYAWGGSLIIAGVAAILDQLPEDPSYAFLRPRFGQRNCWFYGDMEILTYFYGPIGVLLLTNLVLFILTARELTCGLWKREVVKSTTERAALGRVCLKLVVVMGVSWIADILSWAAGGAQELWYLTDVINTLQGLFIFIVIGCQPQVWAAVKRIWCVHQNHTSGATGNGNHHSSSSHGLPSLGDSITNNTLTNMTNATNISVSSKIPLETSC